MKLCHISDVHIGYRHLNHTTAKGYNQREVDVFRAFERTLNAAAALNPELVIISGDLFHVVRPSNEMIVHTYREFYELQSQRDSAPLVIIGGNHDTPRSMGVGCILDLLARISGVSVVHGHAKWVETEVADVLCVPDAAVSEIEQISLVPRRGPKPCVLTVHGLLEGLSARFPDKPLSRSMILRDDWNYIAMGDFHVFRQLQHNAAYAGATEFTTTNIWDEVGFPKGFVSFDTDSKALAHHVVETRKVIDLPAIAAGGLSADELAQRMEAHAPGDRIEGAIVRQRIMDAPIAARSGLDPRRLRDLRRRAFHYLAEYRASKTANPSDSHRVTDAGQTRRTLEDEWRDFAGVRFSSSHDKQALIELGITYLQRAAEKEV